MWNDKNINFKLACKKTNKFQKKILNNLNLFKKICKFLVKIFFYFF